MTPENDAYRKLQKHLDKMPVGYPATKTGEEINILKSIFTPEQAKVAVHLDYRHKSVDQIFETAKGEVNSKEELTRILDEIVSKGGISRRERDGQKQYAVLPFVLWGMYEHQLKRLTPEFLNDAGQYMMGEFGLELATGTIPKMRVIPVEESVEIEHHVATYDELRRLIEAAGDQIAVQDCFCRKASGMQGKHCQATDRREVCMTLGDMADLYVEEGWARRIDQAEALEIARKNEEEGLVLMPGNDQKPGFMCACCRDCCGMLSIMRFTPKPADVVASNFYAQVNSELCAGSEICVGRCPIEAIKVESGVAAVDLARCIGCGLCVPTCPQNAISLVRKPQEVVPPLTQEERYDAMMAQRSSFIGKVRNYSLKTFLRVVTRLSS
jgi:Pyruvate/2-oxoacid:ferredoxin oxidoreductase delta subunit